MSQVSKIPAAVVSQDHGELLYTLPNLRRYNTDALPLSSFLFSFPLTDSLLSIFLSSVFSTPTSCALPTLLAHPSSSSLSYQMGSLFSLWLPSPLPLPFTTSLPNFLPWSALSPITPHALLCSIPSAP